MENTESRFSELVDIVKSWIPQRYDNPPVSRAFWMPDHSCRVCYACEAQFTVFNRKHHCRICGLVFCGKCAATFIPVPSDDQPHDRERMRVCNYCFKEWMKDNKDIMPTRLQSPILSPSLSTTSLASTKSSCTGNSSTTTTVGSASPSTGACRHAQLGSSPCQSEPIHMDQSYAKQDPLVETRNTRSVHMDLGGQAPSQFEFCRNRSDDEDDEYGGCHSDLETQSFPHSHDCYGPIHFDVIDCDYQSAKVPIAEEENIGSKDMYAAVCDNTGLYSSTGVNKVEVASRDNSCVCNAPSPIYSIESKYAETVDFENNDLLWLPPEPEVKEDESEDLLSDDGEDASGEWGYLRSSDSFGHVESRGRERSKEEHKKVMRSVVDEHFRALVAELLQAENLTDGEVDDKESWLEIVTSLSWEAAILLKPDTSKGGRMDPGNYVKVKCIACRHRSESIVIRGVVCKKNVAHRRMESKIAKPRILILGGALEYQRVPNLLSSFDTLLQQEMDHLKLAVAKIDAHRPHILLVEKSVSRFAQDYLLAKHISLVLNVKKTMLERIARCTGAQIIPSIDHLSSPKLGSCEVFHVDKFVEEHVNAGQGKKRIVKTLMFFEGCPKPLGCTVLLKGANYDELKKVKHVIQYAIFAAYHLALETSFLADEGATLPELPLKSPITVALPDKPLSIDRSISTIPGFNISPAKSDALKDAERTKALDAFLATRRLNKLEIPPFLFTAYNHDFKFLESATAIAGPLLDNDSCTSMGHEEFAGPQDHAPLSTGRDQLNLFFEDFPFSSHKELKKNGVEGLEKFRNSRTTDVPYFEGLVNSVATVEALGGHNCMDDANIAKMDCIEGTEKQPDSFYFGALSQGNNQTDEHILMNEEFPPSSDHHSILVSRSTRCVWKGTVCERAHLFRIKYYGNFDKPLGRFLRDNLFDQGYRCRSCEMPSEAHVHCYTHHQGSLTISIRRLPEPLPPLRGERDGKIWMWHRCRRCPRIDGLPPATQRVVMSDAAWGLSFGKFLELSFSNHAAASRVASCGHSLHRDCLRFYGFGRMVACFGYTSIHVHSVYLPPPKLDFYCKQQEWVRKIAEEVTDMADLMFTEVLNSLCHIQEGLKGEVNSSIETPGSRRHIVELEELLQKEKAEFESLFEMAMKREMENGQSFIDILEINKLRRQLLFQSFFWDQRLLLASSPDSKLHEVVLSIMTRNRKFSSNEKLIYLNLPPVPHDISATLDVSSDFCNHESISSSSLFADHVEGHTDHRQHQSLSQQTNDNDLNTCLAQSRILSSCKSSDEQVGSLEPGLSVRRVLSDGHFPMVANLSETLDAKWTGENGPQIADTDISNSATSLECPSSVSAIMKPLEDHTGSRLLSSTHPTKLVDAVDIWSWNSFPFMHIYLWINENWGSAIRLDALSEYNPLFIFSFQELARQGGGRLLLPLGVNDTVIIIFDDEPTSIISYALVSRDYHSQMSERAKGKEGVNASISSSSVDAGLRSSQSVDDVSMNSIKLLGSSSVDDSILALPGSRNSMILDPFECTKAMHLRVPFTDEGPLGKVKYSVTCYYAKQFDALRKICCPSELAFIRSLSRCKKWGAQGGKSNVFFAKSLDDRFIIKQVTKTELESFAKFAPEYFKYLSESVATKSPTCLAKILGIYQVTVRNLKSGKESRMDVLVMENLLFGRNVTRLYDLKGSSRSRYNPDSSGDNKVLLDQNLIEALPTSPIFVGNKAKRLLERAVWNDTSFLASIDVMDYSLLVGVDEEKHELVLGIIDFMRQYTWDKHLETWVKASGILGGPKNTSPTVISPMEYKKRFRKAMAAYFLMVPDQWSPCTIFSSKSLSDLMEDNQFSHNFSTES